MIELRLSILPYELAICRVDARMPLPEWAGGRFTSITRTEEELSIVCESSFVPERVRAERGWRSLKIAGPIAFETTGVASAIVSPLAQAKISVFPIATFDTDYILVKVADLRAAIDVLRRAGHSVDE